jgi:integrase
VSVPSGKRATPPRSLTPADADDLCDRLRSSDDAVRRYDLADLVEFMLGTGCRIGEACAARSKVVDLATGTWEINATAVRVKGRGMVIQERPKTAAGWRVLALPPFVVGMLERRAGELSMSSNAPVIFGSPHVRAIRDPSNTAADLRLVLDALGYTWVTSHTFRRTVATRLDEAGLSGREIADQLGHSKPSMTLDKYMGRGVVTAQAATVLER